MRRQPKARAVKEKARVERFYSLSDRAADKGSKTKMVELVESKSMRMGDVIVEFDDAKLQFGEKKIMDGFSYAFSKGEKIGLVGPNGAGKMTFLKTIMGEIGLDSGWVHVGETIQFGYYSQVADFPDLNMRVVDYVKQVEGEARSTVGSFGGQGEGMTSYKLLERFNFGGPKQMTAIGALSGGEQRRLQLLSVLAFDIQLTGLRGATHLNGRKGIMRGPDPTNNARWTVRLDDGTSVSVKAMHVVHINGRDYKRESP